MPLTETTVAGVVKGIPSNVTSSPGGFVKNTIFVLFGLISLVTVTAMPPESVATK